MQQLAAGGAKGARPMLLFPEVRATACRPAAQLPGMPRHRRWLACWLRPGAPSGAAAAPHGSGRARAQGTTTNGKCLLPFKTGAFLAGVPVQPVVLQYHRVRAAAAAAAAAGAGAGAAVNRR